MKKHVCVTCLSLYQDSARCVWNRVLKDYGEINGYQVIKALVSHFNEINSVDLSKATAKTIKDLRKAFK